MKRAAKKETHRRSIWLWVPVCNARTVSSVAQGAALSPYYAEANYYGPSSNYGPSANYGPSSFFPDTGLNYGKAAGVQDYANAHDYGANSQLQNRGTYNLQDFNVNDFNKGLWANNQFQSQGNNQASAYSDQGRSADTGGH